MLKEPTITMPEQSWPCWNHDNESKRMLYRLQIQQAAVKAARRQVPDAEWTTLHAPDGTLLCQINCLFGTGRHPAELAAAL